MPLLAYEVQMDDGQGTGFVTVTTSDLLQTEISVCASECDYQYIVQRGAWYRFRYRAQNTIGWSDYSPITSVQAARVPF